MDMLEERMKRRKGRATVEQLTAAVYIGLDRGNPEPDFNETQVATDIIHDVKRYRAERGIAGDICEILAHEYMCMRKELKTDNERLSLSRLLVAVGVCPNCESELVHRGSKPFASCACGTTPWPCKFPLVFRRLIKNRAKKLAKAANGLQDEVLSQPAGSTGNSDSQKCKCTSSTGACAQHPSPGPAHPTTGPRPNKHE